MFKLVLTRIKQWPLVKCIIDWEALCSMEVAFTKAEQLEQLPFIATPWGVIVVGLETPIIVIPIYYQLKSFLLVSPTIEKLGIIENLTNNAAEDLYICPLYIHPKYLRNGPIHFLSQIMSSRISNLIENILRCWLVWKILDFPPAVYRLVIQIYTPNKTFCLAMLDRKWANKTS